GRLPQSGVAAATLARPARRRAAGVRRSDSMRSILAAHTWREGVHDRLREAQASTMSFLPLNDLDSGPAYRIPYRSARCYQQRAFSVSGEALSGLGVTSPRHDLLVSTVPFR